MSGRSVLLVALLALVPMSGCFTAAAAKKVRSRHGAEFRCGADTVRVETIDRNTFRAVGCGTSAIYVCADGPTCIRDSAPTSASSPYQAPTR